MNDNNNNKNPVHKCIIQFLHAKRILKKKIAVTWYEYQILFLKIHNTVINKNKNNFKYPLDFNTILNYIKSSIYNLYKGL